MGLSDNHKKMLEQISKTRNVCVDDKVMIVDGLNMFIRVFGAVPTLNDDGEHVGGVTGFLLSLGALIRKHNPTRVLVVFDGKGGSHRRKKLHPGYKDGRSGLTKLNRLAGYEDLEDQSKSMKQQFVTLIKYLDMLPVQMCYIDYVEADDVMAYAARHIFKNEVIIVSSDKDFLQLVDERISVYLPTKKKLMKPDDVKEMYGVPSHNLIFYRMIDGDKSDNIKGIRGVGPKTIVNKLTFLQDSTLDMNSLMESITNMDDDKLKNKLIESSDTLQLNWDLMQLSDPNISSSIKSNIRNILESQINPLNSFLFKREFMIDKLYTAFSNIETWLMNTWSNLDSYAKQIRK